ncbi:MAG: hypothetical protein M1817_001722 [Caeruleum heppii]|nr:MAG: hypothetical protein M1817_001722 [Caeruleum heppii]
MHPLNPFLRAFFHSTLPAQCAPVQNHILLVPTTEVLLNARDRDSHALYADLTSSEDFLGSHVLRAPGIPVPGPAAAAGNARDTKGRAKQFTTVSGKTVVIKDTYVYSNKGFKNLNQAQLLNDVLWYPDSFDAQQWLVYFISKPLVGSLEMLPTLPASLPDPTRPPLPPRTAQASATSPSLTPSKKDIHTFNDLLNHFPMIARQMQPGLEGLFKEFGRTLERSSPPHTAGRPPEISEHHDDAPALPGSIDSQMTEAESDRSNGHARTPLALPGSQDHDREDIMRAALETAVTAAIDLFQLVDKQQLSLLGATTDLTGPLVERLIERYVTEQLHDTMLFPALCNLKRLEDGELDSTIRQMDCIDISQVGIPVKGGSQGKMELSQRLVKGVEQFRKLGVAGSPQEMIQVLLTTEKSITMTGWHEGYRQPAAAHVDGASEKSRPALTINADTLVSLLLVVVIRSHVRHLQACLTYMRHFIFIDDVESGEMGYALSTFEAVLSYLARDSSGLRRASRKNKALWHAVRAGDLGTLRHMLEPEKAFDIEEALVDEPDDMAPSTESLESPGEVRPSCRQTSQTKEIRGSSLKTQQTLVSDNASSSADLRHIFPFQTIQEDRNGDGEIIVPAVRKKVSMETRSLSGSSANSFPSRTTTIDSRGSAVEGDVSVERLSQTHDSTGESILMMAIEHRQGNALKYLISLDEYYPLGMILEDVNHEGTTLLSAAIQSGETIIIETILDRIFQADDDQTISCFLQRQDARGRTAAHYLFNAPYLIRRLGRLIPWRLRDKNGQTPLFALCRSYDHAQYRDMIQTALFMAQQTQPDGGFLHLDDHIDAKGNTLLHVVSDAMLASQLMSHCDSDVNATNEKRFTPIMVASKYGRVDMVRVFFGDPRVDLYARELRGLTAVELAKDDEVRNRIDDLILLSNPAGEGGRTTGVVRSFFVEDSTIRLVIKSAVPSSASTITVTTCRRSLADFEHLAECLSIEHPASWLPSVSGMRSPFQIPSKPSRAVLRDIQVRLDGFLKILLSHPTFATHEMLWEFFLVPDILPEMLTERSHRKSETRREKVKEEYAPVQDVREVESFVEHAREMVRGVSRSSRSVKRRVNKARTVCQDVADAHIMASHVLKTFSFVSSDHLSAFARYSATLIPTEITPLAMFHSDFEAISSTIAAMSSALARPSSLILSMGQTSKAIDRHLSSLRRSDRWPLGLLDDTRNRIHQEAAERVETSRQELLLLGSELRYTQQTVASELAAWQDLHERRARKALRDLARRTVVAEKARLESMKRALRGLPLMH